MNVVNNRKITCYGTCIEEYLVGGFFQKNTLENWKGLLTLNYGTLSNTVEFATPSYHYIVTSSNGWSSNAIINCQSELQIVKYLSNESNWVMATTEMIMFSNNGNTSQGPRFILDRCSCALARITVPKLPFIDSYFFSSKSRDKNAWLFS